MPGQDEVMGRLSEAIARSGEDGYGRMIRAGIERLARQLPSE